MKFGIALGIVALGFASATAAVATTDDLYTNVKNSTVFILTYDAKGDPISRGSGYFVDEGIVITNIHVIGGAAKYYRIFTTSSNDTLDTGCYKDIMRSDIKLNLEDDVAYLRVYVSCPHGSVYFADEDPKVGDTIGIFGYPSAASTNLVYTEGKVLEEVQGGLRGESQNTWLHTDGAINRGNSGGPVVKDGKVVGMAVAAHINSEGKAIDGYFIPVSQIRRGLEYANNSDLGYTPQERQKQAVYEQQKLLEQQNQKRDPFNPIPTGGGVPSSADCRASLGEGAEATGYVAQQGDGCRCLKSYHPNEERTWCDPDALETRRAVVPKKITPAKVAIKPVPVAVKSAKPKSDLKERVCSRVVQRFVRDDKMWSRVNDRVEKQFGFRCTQ